MGKFYITTPIYYPSDNLHIGHAYTTVAADALARYHRLIGDDTYFLTGTDEHGQKIQRKAEAAGTTPQAYVDGIVAGIKDLWRTLAISNDGFIRTTDPRHEEAVQKIFRRLYEQGDIYKSEYEGWYCTPCESFWLDRQLAGGKCPDCGREVELVREESYFFRLSKYADRLLAHIETHPEFIQPASRKNEMINNFLKPGLEDLCVSRTTFNWGIQVPFDPKHVVYVWLDALSNYITALGYPERTGLMERFWPADVHLVGKEIVRFHAIIWPIILMALDLPLPKQIFGHGWLVLEGGKMSKSKGNVIDPAVLIGRYGLDAIRYYLLREVAFGADGSYSEDALILRINTDLANDLGNLLHRTLSMIEKFAGGKVPAPAGYGPLDLEVQATAAECLASMEEHMGRLEISDAVAAIFRLVAKTNKYIDDAAPWSLAKKPETRDRLSSVLYTMAESLRIAAVALTPFLVETPGKIWRQLGLKGDPAAAWSERAWGGFPPGTAVAKGEPIFPRIEPAKTDVPDATPTGIAAQGASRPEGTPPTRANKEPESHLVEIDEFARLDLRVAKVLAAKPVEGAKKLLQLEIMVNGASRQILAGIAEHYKPEELVDREIVVVANLKPARIRGLESQGMLLAASNDRGEVVLIAPDRPVGEGSKVR